VKEGVTTPEQLAIMGGSNGGLLVAACLTQRPELYAAAVSQVPVADMLRFHKFTIGYAWCSDYGNADEDREQFEYMLGYSPVHNTGKIRGKRIPATLVCTADHDDRVVPLHSYKFTAALQRDAAESDRPALIRIDVKAGHGAGKPTAKVIAEYADVWSFVAAHTGARLR
jgi:prolyl oligopeptidase